ncbi:hypothetical protein MRX96_007541 [Rhipicephalus microplus]
MMKWPRIPIRRRGHLPASAHPDGTSIVADGCKASRTSQKRRVTLIDGDRVVPSHLLPPPSSALANFLSFTDLLLGPSTEGVLSRFCPHPEHVTLSATASAAGSL